MKSPKNVIIQKMKSPKKEMKSQKNISQKKSNFK